MSSLRCLTALMCCWVSIHLTACNGEGGDGDKLPGTEGGPCYPNMTCNNGLICLSNTCGRLPDSRIDTASSDARGDTLPTDLSTPDARPDSRKADLSKKPDLFMADLSKSDLKADASPDAKKDTKADVANPDAFSTQGYVYISPVTFMMGSPTIEPCRDTNEDLHQVTLTHGFEISDHEVTQAEFQILMGYSPSSFSTCGTGCPVETVNWHEAAAYCSALSAQKGLAVCYTCSGSGAGVTCAEASAYSGQNIYTCPGYRLPTEAEWEYAYRAGTSTAYYNGANAPAKCLLCTGICDVNAAAIGWHCCNSGMTTHPIKQKVTNAWGLYDMAGNVWEWCHDRYQSSLGSSAVTNPVGSGSSYRLVRGGGWYDAASGERAACRGNLTPTTQYYSIGVRCCRTK